MIKLKFVIKKCIFLEIVSSYCYVLTIVNYNTSITYHVVCDLFNITFIPDSRATKSNEHTVWSYGQGYVHKVIKK